MNESSVYSFVIVIDVHGQESRIDAGAYLQEALSTDGLVADTTVDYRDLFIRSLNRLRTVMASRNAFSSDLRNVLDGYSHLKWRDPAVETMHRDAQSFLDEHSHHLPEEQSWPTS